MCVGKLKREKKEQTKIVYFYRELPLPFYANSIHPCTCLNRA